MAAVPTVNSDPATLFCYILYIPVALLYRASLSRLLIRLFYPSAAFFSPHLVSTYILALLFLLLPSHTPVTFA